MKTEKLVCSICGQKLKDLDEYVKHIQECANREKEEQIKEYEKNVSVALKKVATAKSYYEECLNDFKRQYPKEYETYIAKNNLGKKEESSEINESMLDDAILTSLLSLIRTCM